MPAAARVRKMPLEMPFALSTVAAPELKIVRRGKVQFALSTVDPRIDAIEKQRVARQISKNKLCGASQVHPTTYFYLRTGQQQPHVDTVGRLEKALAEFPATRRKLDLVAPFVAAAEAIVRAETRGDRKLTRALTFERKRRRRHGRLSRMRKSASRFRMVAIYLAAVEIEIGNAEIARALATTRQNVHKARKMIEDLRDSKLVDALLERCRVLLKGGDQ